MNKHPDDPIFDALAYLRALATGDRAGQDVILTHCDPYAVLSVVGGAAVEHLRQLGHGDAAATNDRWREALVAPDEHQESA